MANIFNGVNQWMIDTFGSGFARLKDKNGNELAPGVSTKLDVDLSGLVVAGANDNYALPLRVDRLGNLIIGNTQPILTEYFEGTVLNTNRWTLASTNFITGQTAGQFNFTTTAITTAGANANIISTRRFARLQRQPLQFKARVRAQLVSNTLFELGFGAPVTTTATINDSAYWRITGTSAVPVLTSNTSEITGTPVDVSTYGNDFLTYDVIIDDDGVNFIIQDTQLQTIISKQSLSVQRSWTRIFVSTHTPAFLRLYQVNAPATAPTVLVTDVTVVGHDMYFNRTNPELSAILGFPATQVPGNVTTTTNSANSAAPASATLSNTAAGYTTLQGQFQFVAPAGAETDYCLFGYTVPTGFTLLVDGIRIEAFNMGAAVATTPHTLQWGVVNDSGGVSLATTNQLRRLLGVMTADIGTVIGGKFDTVISERFTTPLKTDGGKFFIVYLKIPVGTATVSQIIRGTVHIDARFE